MKKALSILVSIVFVVGLVQITRGFLSGSVSPAGGIMCLGGYQCSGVGDQGVKCGATGGPVCHCVWESNIQDTVCYKDVPPPR